MGTIHQALYSSSYTRFMGVKTKTKTKKAIPNPQRYALHIHEKAQ
jgi:hypothetical protein